MARKTFKDDDGRIIADMNVEGMPGYISKKHKKHQAELKKVKLTRKEKWAITKATYQAFLPMFLCIVAGFSAVAILIWLWLR